MHCIDVLNNIFKLSPKKCALSFLMFFIFAILSYNPALLHASDDMTDTNAFSFYRMDFFTIGVVIIFSALGFLRGFIKEIIKIFGTMFAIYISYSYSSALYGTIFSSEANQIPLIASIVSGLVIFAISTTVISIIILAISIILRPIRLGIFDRTFGFILGFIKGSTIAFFIYALVDVGYKLTNPSIFNKDLTQKEIDHNMPDWFIKGITYPTYKIVDGVILNILPHDISTKLHSSAEQVTYALGKYTNLSSHVEKVSTIHDDIKESIQNKIDNNINTLINIKKNNTSDSHNEKNKDPDEKE